MMRQICGMAWIALLIGTAAAGACWMAAGATLGLFFGGVAFCTILVPPLVLSEPRLIDRLVITAAIIDGTAVVWLIAAFTPALSLVQFLICYAVLIAWCVALLGLAWLAASVLRADVPAAATATLLGLIWLTAPVWLKSHAGAIVAVHPLMTLNGVLIHMGYWTQRPIAYTYLFSLGQDVPYVLPRNILPMVSVHLSVGVVALMLGRVAGRRWTLRSTNQIDASASRNISE
jgi:hypothetical protein